MRMSGWGRMGRESRGLRVGLSWLSDGQLQKAGTDPVADGAEQLGRPGPVRGAVDVSSPLTLRAALQAGAAVLHL